MDVQIECTDHASRIILNGETRNVASLQKSLSDEYGSSPNTLLGNLQVPENESDDDAPKKRKRRIQQFSDSDTDMKEKANSGDSDVESHKLEDSDSDMLIFKSGPHKSRIRRSSKSSDSDASHSGLVKLANSDDLGVPGKSQDSDSDSDITILKSNRQKSYIQRTTNSSKPDSSVKNQEQQTRVKNKRNKLQDKFKSLISSRGKDGKGNESSDNLNHGFDSEGSNNDSSTEKIKQIIKEGIYIPSICDPDTSDEEINPPISVKRQTKDKRSTKLTSPKPQRMSAKQAMENMQKIKSESNRMLREKEISLPYHKPKSLSLKDIMSRRKVAVSLDGKTLPIKMNGEQLKQYAQMLEDRQKQMMELLQSDSDEEENDENETNVKTVDNAKPENNVLSAENTVDQPKQTELIVNETGKVSDADVTAIENDELFDCLSQNNADVSKLDDTSNECQNREEKVAKSTIEEKFTEEQDSETNMKLVFNDSETSITDNTESCNLLVKNHDIETCLTSSEVNRKDKQNNTDSTKTNTEDESQLISLHYDSEKKHAVYTETLDDDMFSKDDKEIVQIEKCEERASVDNIEESNEEVMDVDAFSDDEINMEEIDNIIENAEIIRDIEEKLNSQVLIRGMQLNVKPKLTGAPGMVIDLDDSKTLPKKSGVELLKERFTFFAKLKTPEELERENDKKIKPGTQHLKLKQVLEEQMAEQRSLEWAKRIEEEKQQQRDLKELQDEESGGETDIDKIEAKCDEHYAKEVDDEESESEEEELLENDIEMKDKPRMKNCMVADEADESDCDENEVENNEEDIEQNEEKETDVDNNDYDHNGGDEYEDSSDDSESSESEEEQPINTKKGRILKAFADSDDEDATDKEKQETEEYTETKSDVGSVDLLGSQYSQDDVLTLAQRHNSVSEYLFTSQGTTLPASQSAETQVASENPENDDVDLGTQTFSILDSLKNTTAVGVNCSSKLSVICETRPYGDNFDDVIFPDSISQNLMHVPTTQTSQSQPIGEDILELCTGQFYDNEFVSQLGNSSQMPLGASQELESCDDASQKTTPSNETCALDLNSKVIDAMQVTDKANEIKEAVVINEENADKIPSEIASTNSKKVVDDNLKSILDELDDPEFDVIKPNKFFCGGKSLVDTGTTQKEKDVLIESQIKKKFIIESDDESSDAKTEINKKKKLKKRKPEKRALQISDDEDEESEQNEEEEEFESDIEEGFVERVEYDSEENEIEVKPQLKQSKKRGKGTEFFEQEAELTSEDEWLGSGDEDEAGLDRMEREAGDDDSFHQGRLQRELGQIHIRDVLDQDKREVRIIQELLFEDGDLGGGGRQRKFKWRSIDGEDDAGASADEVRDTQQEEYESEEQWRKQRHERETFLRQMQNNDDIEDSLDISINGTSITNANLSTKSASVLNDENNTTTQDGAAEKNSAKDIPTPKNPFTYLQQSYQGSILNRGRGALARLAALATPLAVDDDAHKVGSLVPGTSRRNFVFAALTPEPPKVQKRKADVNPSTPKLVKKMKTEEKQNRLSKNSLLNHI